MFADEAAVRRLVEDKVRGAAQVEAVRKAPWGGLFEVVVRGPDGAQIFYVDAQATVIVAGQAIDARSGRNLTDERLRSLSQIRWASLPFDDASKLDDITVHVFLYPVISPASVAQTKAVWCSEDRQRAWNDLMLRDIQPTARTDCEAPIEKLVAPARGGAPPSRRSLAARTMMAPQTRMRR